MLDIVITHYTEPWEVCRRLLETLDAQRGVDWSEIYVTVVNDGGRRLPEEKLEDLAFRCVQLDVPQGGISAARNAGLDHAEEPWVMFCDCDDCFSNVFALADILDVLRSEDRKYDMYWMKVWAEDPEKGRIYEIQDIKVMVFIHGKIYSREFLTKEGIRFDESLAFNEDSCFNATILTRIPNTRIGEIRTYAPPYVWIRREGSVTTGEGAEDKSAIGQLQRNIVVANEYMIHKPELFPGMVTRVVYDAFFMVHSRRCSPSCKQKILEIFLPWIREHEGLFLRVDGKTLKKIRMISRDELSGKDEEICDDPGNVLAWLKMETQG